MTALFERLDLWPLLLALAALAAAAAWCTSRRRARTERVLAPDRLVHLAPGLSPGRRRVRFACVLATLATGVAAALDPVWGEEVLLVEQRGVDVVVALDVSRSMLARDVAPSRLERAKLEVAALAARARGDRLGLVVFAGEARLSVPLTHDLDTFRGLVEPVDPFSVRRGGTDLGRALDAATEALAEARGEARAGQYEVILLLTDGEDLEGRGLAAAKRAAAQGITIHCVGFGSTRGSKIALEGGSGGESFLTDDRGEEVVSAMDSESLRRMASESGGEFLRADAVPLPLLEIYDKRILPSARRVYDAQEQSSKKHRFQWLLFLAIPLGLVALALPERKGLPAGTRPRSDSVRSPRAAMTASLSLALLPLLVPAPARADDFADGVKALRERRYADALAALTRAEEEAAGEAPPELLFDRALAALGTGDPHGAEAAAERAAARGGAVFERARDFLRGNTQFLLAEAAEQRVEAAQAPPAAPDAPPPAIDPSAWDEPIRFAEGARDAWIAAAAAGAEDIPAARRNVERALRKIEELKRKKSDAEQQKKEQDEQKDEQKQDEQSPPESQPKDGEKGDSKPDEQPKDDQQPKDDEPKQDPGEPEPEASEEPIAPGETETKELPAEQVQRLLDKLDEKEKQRLELRKAKAQKVVVPRDW